MMSEPMYIKIGNPVPLADREEVMTVSKLSSKCGYSEGHLRRLLRLNKIEGDKIGTFWLTTYSTVKKYQAQMKERRKDIVKKPYAMRGGDS